MGYSNRKRTFIKKASSIAIRQAVLKPKAAKQWHKAELNLSYEPPLDWLGVMEFFNHHEISGTEMVAPDSYQRVFNLGGVHGFLRVTHHQVKLALVLEVIVENKKILPKLIARVRMMFDLDTDHSAMLGVLGAYDIFHAMTKSYPGLRVVKAFDRFEATILTVLGQLVSVKRAKQMMGELVEKHGEPVIHPLSNEKYYVFPTPSKLAKADLSHLGTTQIRKRLLKELATLVAKGKIDLVNDEVEVLKEKLLTIPGIGNWTVEYIAMRGFGHTDAFPSTDLVLKRATDTYPKLNIEKVRPWRSYAALYLWKDYSMQPKKYKGAKK